MKKIVVTSTTCPDLEFEDVEVVHVPLLVTFCLEFDVPAFESAVFYSKHGVRCAHAAGVDLTGKDVFAVGESTAALIAGLFAASPAIPEEQNFEGLVEKFRERKPRGPVASFELANSPRTLAHVLDDVVVVPTYLTKMRTDPALAKVLHPADAILFASPRAVEAYSNFAPPPPLAGSIGPTTSAALHEAGFEPILETDPPNLDQLLTELVARLRT